MDVCGEVTEKSKIVSYFMLFDILRTTLWYWKHPCVS